MNKYIKQNQSRDNLNKKQKQIFKNYLTDNKDCLVDLSDNLFVPFHGRTDEEYLAFKKGKGKELVEKLRAPHSSAALCVNFFKYWKEKDPIGFYKILWETMRSKKLGQNENLSQVEYEFEAEHLFGNNESRQTGRPGYIDLEVRTTDGLELIHIESKFTEDFPLVTRYVEANLTNGKIHNREAYRNLFETYFECEPDELMNGSEMSKCYQLAQRLLFVVENANDHYASYPEAHVLFLHYDYDGFDKDLLDFPSAIKKPYKDQFKILSYQSLFEALQNSFLNVERHKGWFEYMRRRYFSLK